MTELPELLGQGDDFARLRRAARERRLHHGVLLLGPRGCGKSLAARWLARDLLCGDRDEGAPQVQRAARGSHPDLHVVTLPEDRQDIPVDAVRELSATLERAPVEAGARVAIVDPADRLNEQGQNALLKTLEEPGEATWLLLVTNRPEALLETIRSRSLAQRVLPLDDVTLRAALDPVALRELSPAEGEALVRDAQGSLGLARSMLDPEMRELGERLDRFFAEPAADPGATAAELLGGASGRTASEARLRVVLWTLRQRLRARLLESVASPAGPLYASGNTSWTTAALDAVLAAESDAAAGIPVGSVLEAALAELREAEPRGDAPGW
jgi:DNA polymerase-3 subunit delta'